MSQITKIFCVKFTSVLILDTNNCKHFVQNFQIYPRTCVKWPVLQQMMMARFTANDGQEEYDDENNDGNDNVDDDK